MQPSKVASLIVVDISPIIAEHGILRDFFPKVIKAMKSVDFSGADSLIKARSAAKTKLAEFFDNEETMFFVLMNIGNLSDNSIGWKCNIKALAKHFPNIAGFPDMAGKTYNGPTLFIGGKMSDFIP